MNQRLIERVAKAICTKLGHHPNELVMLLEHPLHGAKNHVVMEGSAARTVLSWTLYWAEAEAAVAALSSYLAPEHDTKKPEDAYAEHD